MGLLGWVQGEGEAWGGGGDELNMKLQQRPHFCLPENWELSVPNTPNAEQEGLSSDRKVWLTQAPVDEY